MATACVLCRELRASKNNRFILRPQLRFHRVNRIVRSLWHFALQRSSFYESILSRRRTPRLYLGMRLHNILGSESVKRYPNNSGVHGMETSSQHPHVRSVIQAPHRMLQVAASCCSQCNVSVFLTTVALDTWACLWKRIIQHSVYIELFRTTLLQAWAVEHVRVTVPYGCSVNRYRFWGHQKVKGQSCKLTYRRSWP